MKNPRNISVLGAGSWGATLASHLAAKKYRVTLWEFDAAAAKRLSRTRTLATLPTLRIPRDVAITPEMKDISGSDIIVVAAPSFAFAQTLASAAKADFLSPPGVVIATKGFVGGKELFPSEAAAEIFSKSKTAVLTGPSHAEEVSRRMPTAVVAASSDPAFASMTQRIFYTETFRVYANTDVRGCECAGALKNIYAIAAGIADGLGLGDNTKAALVTRSLSEMSRLGEALGGRPKTFLGLAGAGDLMVTCYSRHSRNRNLGEMIGRGISLNRALSRIAMVAEGVYAAKRFGALKRRLAADTPIADEVYAILFHGKSAVKSIKSLMTRPLKTE